MDLGFENLTYVHNYLCEVYKMISIESLSVLYSSTEKSKVRVVMTGLYNKYRNGVHKAIMLIEYIGNMIMSGNHSNIYGFYEKLDTPEYYKEMRTI